MRKKDQALKKPRYLNNRGDVVESHHDNEILLLISQSRNKNLFIFAYSQEIDGNNQYSIKSHNLIQDLWLFE